MSRVSRVYLPSSCFTESQVHLTEEAAHYLGRVLRLRPGDRWAALDGAGRSWLCQLDDRHSSHRVEDWPAVPPPPTRLEVGLALCKGTRFEDALEKLAELGVARVIPLETERTERGRPSPARAERWRQIALSGSALANRLIPLEIAPVSGLSEVLDGLDRGSSFYCHLGGGPARELLVGTPPQRTLLIGPEGGFAPGELESLEQRAQRVCLGPLTLRVETAAVCACTLALADGWIESSE
jgi:16S rRNA (uracil1498-N3)-methyltransferase